MMHGVKGVRCMWCIGISWLIDGWINAFRLGLTLNIHHRNEKRVSEIGIAPQVQKNDIFS